MTSSLLRDILKLTIAERIQLVQEIWDSIITTPESVPLTNSQSQELDRRLEVYEQDPTSGTSWEEVKQRIMNKA